MTAMPKAIVPALLLSWLGCTSLSGCGQMGPLTLPDAGPSDGSQSAAPATDAEAGEDDDER
jgi:predicted small lipoprotein YifL